MLHLCRSLANLTSLSYWEANSKNKMPGLHFSVKIIACPYCSVKSNHNYSTWASSFISVILTEDYGGSGTVAWNISKIIHGSNVIVTLPVYSRLGPSSTTLLSWRTRNVTLIQVLTELGGKRKQNRNPIFCNKCKGWESLNSGWFIGLQTLEWQRACVRNLWIQLVSQAARPPLFSSSSDIQRATVDLPSVEKGKLGCFSLSVVTSMKDRAFVLTAMFEAAFPV